MKCLNCVGGLIVEGIGICTLQTSKLRNGSFNKKFITILIYIIAAMVFVSLQNKEFQALETNMENN